MLSGDSQYNKTPYILSHLISNFLSCFPRDESRYEYVCAVSNMSIMGILWIHIVSAREFDWTSTYQYQLLIWNLIPHTVELPDVTSGSSFWYLIRPYSFSRQYFHRSIRWI